MDNKTYKSTINGSIAGGLGYIVTLPIDAIKQNIQTGNKIISKDFKSYFKGGLLGLYCIVPQMAIKFSSNSYLEHHYKMNPYINGLISGSMDGAFLGPILASQSLQQMNNKLNYKDSLHIMKQKSIGNLFNLCIPMSLRNGVYTSIVFGGYKQMCITPNIKNTFIQDFYMISLLNIPATILSCPFDVIRAVQTKNLLENKNINFLDICKSIYKNNGLLGFFKGYKILYINFAIRFPLTLSIFNYMSS